MLKFVFVYLANTAVVCYSLTIIFCCQVQDYIYWIISTENDHRHHHKFITLKSWTFLSLDAISCETSVSSKWNKCRIYVGDQLDRWNELKEVAKILFQCSKLYSYANILLSDVTVWSSENWFFVGFSVNSTPKCAQFDIRTLCSNLVTVAKRKTRF
jgi:hypothetical protein